MKTYLISLMALAVFSGSVPAADLYSHLESTFRTASLPNSRHMRAESIWTGKCVAPNQPNMFFDGAIFFHVQKDDVLGNLFYMVPMYGNLRDDDLRYSQLHDLGMRMITTGQIGGTISIVSNNWYSTMGTSDYPSRRDYLRETTTVNHTPAFVMQSFREDDYQDSVFCYFSQDLNGGQTGTVSPVVPPPPPQ